MVEDLMGKDCLVLGCGNPLFGDDGFGAKVIECLQRRYPPGDRVGYFDVGTSVREILFDLLLAERKPRLLIIVDTGRDVARAPGEIFEVQVNAMIPAKIHDYSLHQFPTTNMLKELQQETDVNVRIFVVQPEKIPSRVQEGLTASVAAAVATMAERISRIIEEEGYG